MPPLAPNLPALEQQKLLANLVAAFALRGHEVRELPDGAGWVIGRWGLFKFCASLDELQAAARQMLGVIE